MTHFEREYQIGEARFLYGADGICRMKLHGPGEAAMVNSILANDREVKEDTGTTWHYLVDFDKAGRPSPEAGKVWRKITHDRLTGKVAVFGTHPVARVLGAFFIGLSRQKHMRFFKSEEEALEWLRS